MKKKNNIYKGYYSNLTSPRLEIACLENKKERQKHKITKMITKMLDHFIAAIIGYIVTLILSKFH